MTTLADRLSALIAEYASQDASAAWLLCDRHPPEAVAFTVVDDELQARDHTFGELRARSERFAGALAELGIGPGDRVAVLMGKSADLVVAALGIWRIGAVYVPLFTAFATPAIALRLNAAGAKAVVVDADQRAKLDPGPDLPAQPPWRVVTAGWPGRAGELRLDELIARGPAARAAALGGEAPLVLLFTSGTTGDPKGVAIPLAALPSMVAYQKYALDVRRDDVYWNAADPGWAYGLYYALLAPLALGMRSLLVRAPFSAALTYCVLSRFGVTNFAAAPTVYRALRNDPTPPPNDLRLRCCSSAGELLNAELVTWAHAALGVPVHDHYGQTELGMVVANGHHPAIRRALRPGSMGHPLPGFTVDVVDPAGNPVEPGMKGQVAVDRTASPLLWFHRYAHAPERIAERITPDGRWYLTGDLATKDAQGYVTFSSRDDDVIIMAGYRIGPFEIESVLLEHAAVAEAAVVGAPDELRGEVVEAFVVVRPGAVADDALVDELQQLVKRRHAAHSYPRRVHFVAALPKTPSGKIQRFALRERLRTVGV